MEILWIWIFLNYMAKENYAEWGDQTIILTSN